MLPFVFFAFGNELPCGSHPAGLQNADAEHAVRPGSDDPLFERAAGRCWRGCLATTAASPRQHGGSPLPVRPAAGGVALGFSEPGEFFMFPLVGLNLAQRGTGLCFRAPRCLCESDTARRPGWTCHFWRGRRAPKNDPNASCVVAESVMASGPGRGGAFLAGPRYGLPRTFTSRR